MSEIETRLRIADAFANANIDAEIEVTIEGGFVTQEVAEDITAAMRRINPPPAPKIPPITSSTRTKAHLFQRTFSGVPAWVCHGKGEISFGLTKPEAFARWQSIVAFRAQDNRRDPADAIRLVPQLSEPIWNALFFGRGA